jgi:hypothetical protein
MARSGQSTGPPSHVVDPISKLRRPTPPLSPGRESHAQRPTTSLQPRARSHGPRSFFLAGYFERGRHSPTMGSVDVEGHTKDDSGDDRPGGGCRDNEPSAPSSMHVVDTHSTTHERVDSALPSEAHGEPHGWGTSHSPMAIERMLLTEIRPRILGKLRFKTCASFRGLLNPVRNVWATQPRWK